MIVDYIDAHRDQFGVDPICTVLAEHGLPIAPSTYYAAKARGPVSDATWAEAHAANTVHRLYVANRRLYGVRKMWHAMKHAGHEIGRDQVARLMRICGITGVVRGKRCTITTTADPVAARHPDLIDRQWGAPTRPDQWWVADFTYVWTLQGFVYTAFCVDVYSRRILGWRVMSTKATPLVTSVLEQALFTRRRTDFRFTTTGLVHHSDAGSPIHLAGVHRRFGGVGYRRLHRFGRRCPRQRVDGIRDRAVQDRTDRAGRIVDRAGRGRTGNGHLGALVQHHPAALLARLSLTDRLREPLP